MSELVSLNRSNELDNTKNESVTAKLQRETHLLLGGLAEGTLESAQKGFSSEHYLRTAANIGLAAALTVAMKRPGILGNVARGAGTIGALNFVGDLASPRRLSALGSAMQETWYSADHFQRNYGVVKKELGTVGFDTMLGVAGGAIGAGLATKFMRPGTSAATAAAEKLSLAEPVAGTKGSAFDKLSVVENPGAIVKPGTIERTGVLEKPGVLEKSGPLEKTGGLAGSQEAINVFSKSNEPLGRALSNFAHTPFELDGVRYASVEAFYQGLKFLDPVKRAEIAPLYGSYAKNAANKAPSINETLYMGEKIKLGSLEHHALMERAIRAKIAQNPEIMQGLMESQNRSIVHDTGRASVRKSNFPDTVFADMLTKIRQDLIAKGEMPIQTTAAGTSSLAGIEVKGGKSTSVLPSTRDTVTGADRIQVAPVVPPEPLPSVSDALLSIEKPRLAEVHNLSDYAAAFQGFDRKVSKVIGGGSDSIVLRLDDGNVLKITTNALPPDLGKRVFDLPVLEQGSRVIDGRHINYFVQPHAQPGKPVDLHAIGESVRLSGYHFQEPFLNQVGRYEGRPFLLDPWAVKKK